MLKAKNFAISELASGVSDVATTWALKSGDGAKFPTSGDFHVACETEIALCTARTGDSLTVTRGQDNTTAAAHSAGRGVGLVLSAGTVEEVQAHLPLTAAHGATGAVVGTTSAQTITNKRIQPRVYTVAATSVIPDTAQYDIYIRAQNGGTFTINTPTAGYVSGERFSMRIRNTASSSLTLSWSAIYRNIVGGATPPNMPASLAGNATNYIVYYGFQYNAEDSKWDCIAVSLGRAA